MIAFQNLSRTLLTVCVVLTAQPSTADSLACSEGFAERVCVKTDLGTCEPDKAQEYADRILLALKDAHPTLRRLACDVDRYIVEDLEYSAGNIKSSGFVIMRLDPLNFDAAWSSEESLQGRVKRWNAHSNIWANGLSTPYSGLQYVLYHELAHYLELGSSLEFPAFNCSEFEPTSPTLTAMKLCWSDDECSLDFTDEEISDSLADLKTMRHISFYSLKNHREDFAELVSRSLLLSKTGSTAHYGYNGKIIFDLNEAIISDRMAQKMRIVSLMLDFPFDDPEKAEKLMYENAICIGAFARSPAG